jgi:DNA invertase Pin-like site-specific DNA recombinase
MMDHMTSCAIYTRISDDRERTSLSPENQEAECRAYAAGQGWEVAAVFSDRDLSGWKPGVVRPHFNEAVAQARAGKFDRLIVWKLDRFTRQGLRAIEFVMDLGDCSLVSVIDHIDTTTSGGRIALAAVLEQARGESENISLRVSMAARNAAKAGRVRRQRTRTFGYADNTLQTEHPTEGQIVRDMTDRALAGESFGSVARWLNDAGYLTINGNYWTASTIAGYLRNPTIAAISAYRDGAIVRQGQWHALITQDQHQAIKGLAPKVNRTVSVQFPLTTLLYCSCGARMGMHKAEGRRRYVCQARENPNKAAREAAAKHHPETATNSVTFDGLTKHVRSELFAHLGNMDHIDGNDWSHNSAELATDLERTRDALSDLAKARFVTNTINESDYDSIYAELSAYQAAVEGAIKRNVDAANRIDIQHHMPKTAAEFELAHDMGIIRLEELAKAAIARVVINPTTKRGRIFDTSRVVIEWHDRLQASDELVTQVMTWASTHTAEKDGIPAMFTGTRAQLAHADYDIQN